MRRGVIKNCILTGVIQRFLPLWALAAALPLAACSSVEKRLLSELPLVRAEALESAAAAPPAKKKKIVSAMGKKLSHDRPDLRAYAATALEDIGPAAAGAAPALIRALDDADSAVSGAAQRTLSKLPEAAPALAAALASDDEALCAKLRHLLAAHGDAGALALGRNFESGSRGLALKSAGALALMGPAAAKGVPALARAILGNDAQVRTAAASALSDIGAPAALWLGSALGSASPQSRSGAATVLAALPRPLPEALEALVKALADADEGVRRNSTAALAAYPPDVMAALPQELLPLLSAAAEGEGETAGRARIALAKTGRAPGRALEEALKSPDSAQREAAALALILMFPPPREPAARLFPALNDIELKVRRAAAAAIGNYAISNPAVLPPDSAARLLAALNNSDSETRSLAVFPLRHLAASDKKAFAALVSALAHKDPAVSVAAADALGAAGPKAAAALPALWKAFAVKDCLRRLAAAKALAAVKPSLKSNPALAQTLKAGCPAGKAGRPAKRPF